MFKKFFSYLFKDFYLFTLAYSNNVFPEPLSKEEEEQLIDIFIKSSLYEMDFWNMANK